MKRVGCVLTVLTLSLLLTGCGAEVSEEQNRIMAEYAADLLLKYDANYQSRLLDSEEMPDSGTESEAPTEASDQEDSSSATEAESGTEDSRQPVEPEVTELAGILGLEEVSITFSDCTFTDSYPSEEQPDPYVDLVADEGYTLAVLHFNIRNLSTQEREIDLLHNQVSYQLLLNGSKTAKPMLTILTEDLGTFQGTVSGEGEQPAVLVFQISDTLVDEIDTLNLRITYQEQVYVMHVK